MADFNITSNNGFQGTANYDRSKVFSFANRTITETYTNNTGATVTLLAGTVMGRVSGTGILIPFTSGATDGSQFILGVLMADIILGAGGTMNIPVCVSGDVIADKLIFQGTDTLNSVANGRMLKDRTGGDSVGIKLVYSTEMTDFDN